MIVSILAALRTLLHDDSTLQGLLGGAYVYLGWKTNKMHVPCVTIVENNESSFRRTCYDQFKTRDNAPTIQIDIWVDENSETAPNAPEDIEPIANRIDVLLFRTGVTNTRAWGRVSSSGPYPEENLFHKALRYRFEFSIIDP